MEVAATALAHLGISRPAEPDGERLDRPDTTRSRRSPAPCGQPPTRASRRACSAGPTPPAGWSIDNDNMGAGGVTERRGWSLTDEFWTAADRGQQRENNIRARGVAAVADPDEWSDRPTTGAFDSTLAAPPVRVSGKRTVRVAFQLHYMHFGNQRARVLVSFDGGADQEVLRYTGDAKARTRTRDTRHGTRRAGGTDDHNVGTVQMDYDLTARRERGADHASSQGLAEVNMDKMPTARAENA